jgi:hypothetical protein
LPAPGGGCDTGHRLRRRSRFRCRADDAAQVEATLAISVPGGGCSPVEAAAAISVLGGVSGRSMRSCGGGACDPCAGRRMRLWRRRRRAQVELI